MADKEAKKQAEMQLAGQDSDTARDAVKRQRELKKKRDALRKSQKKLKSMKPEDSAYAATQEEMAQLEADIKELEGESGDAAVPVPNASQPQPAPAAAPAAAAVAPASTEGVGRTEKAAAAVEEDLEGNAARLREMVERAMRASRGTLMPRLVESVVHPRVAEVTVMMEKMRIVGGNARTLAMIAAFREMFLTTTTLAGSSLQDIDTQAFAKLVDANFAFMCRRRDANAGMRYVKESVVCRLVALRDELVQHRHRRRSEERKARVDAQSARLTAALESVSGDAREVALQILEMLETEIYISVKSIVEDRSLPYVSNTDTILVFGRSSVVEFILLSRVHSPQRRPKKVIVVDSAPLYEGRELAHKLSEVGLDVTYGLITAACTLIPKCTRVFIGAASVLQNGDVFGRCGTALIAACAKTFHKPVLCFAESYKFVAEVWVGNLAQNAKLNDIREAPAVHEAAGRSPLALTPPSSTAQQPGTMFGDAGDRLWGRGAGDGTPLLFPSAASDLWSAAPPAPTLGMAPAAASGYLYDLTPAAYVDMIICEMGCLHTSAIIAAIKDREGRDASPALYLASRVTL